MFSSSPIVSQYGLWEQLRVDGGKEWYLMLAIQQKLSTLRVNQNRPAYLQTTSTMVCTCMHVPKVAHTYSYSYIRFCM